MALSNKTGQIVENKSSFLRWLDLHQSHTFHICCSMKKLVLVDMKTTWMYPKPQISSSAEAMVPAYTPQQQEQPQEERPFSRDKHFALHGEILMLVLVGIFSIFLISLVLIPCLKRRKTPESGDDEDSTMQGSFDFLSLRKRRRPIDT